LRLFSFGGYGLALVVFGAIECPPPLPTFSETLFFKKGDQRCLEAPGEKKKNIANP